MFYHVFGLIHESECRCNSYVVVQEMFVGLNKVYSVVGGDSSGVVVRGKEMIVVEVLDVCLDCRVMATFLIL